jgi:pyridoxine 5-phosphate synthase
MMLQIDSHRPFSEGGIGMAKLGVNIDHVATIRQARRTIEPDPVWAAALAELGGADGITIHLREDRRHIQDRDLRVLRETVQVKLNLEMAASDEITRIALEVSPDQCTLVPEKREEITTEGGLDVIGQRDRINRCVDQLLAAGIEASLFIDPDAAQIDASQALGVHAVELHTGRYADATDETTRNRELAALVSAGGVALKHGLLLHMGHGLTYRNVVPVARIVGVSELNIGHSIVARAVMVGFERAVREMKDLVQ